MCPTRRLFKPQSQDRSEVMGSAWKARAAISVPVLLITLAMALAAPLAAEAQPPPRLPQVGLLSTGSDPTTVLSAALAALGHVDGKTIILQGRFAKGRV